MRQVSVVAKVYSIRVTRQDFFHIKKIDLNPPLAVNRQPLYRLLLSIRGITEVDYSGKEAPYIYVRVQKAFDRPSLWESVEYMINRYLVEG